MSGDNNHAGDEDAWEGSQQLDQPDKREKNREVDTDLATEFGQVGAQIVKRYQVGQITLQEGMVQLALEVTRADITPEKMQSVAQYYYRELAWVQGAIARNTQAGIGNQSRSAAPRPIDASLTLKD